MSEIKSPMTGNIWKIKVKPGDEVDFGDEIIIIESMKMEIPLESDAAGIVSEVLVAEGDAVAEGDVVITLK